MRCGPGHVAQLDRASDSGSEGRGFESLRARLYDCNSITIGWIGYILKGGIASRHHSLPDELAAERLEFAAKGGP